MEKFELITTGKSTKQLIKKVTHEKMLEQVKEYLSEHKFNYVVTAENLKEVKDNNAELNKTSKFLKEFSKQLIDAESQDINNFKENIKTYTDMIEEKRQQRLSAINEYESKTRDTVKVLISEYINERYITLGIREQYQNTSGDDLALISNFNEKTITLSKKCRDTLDTRIQLCKFSQDRYDLRVAQLKNVCYENGLTVPLEVSHIQGIINLENESEYQSKLNDLIKDEISRHERIKQQQEEQHKRDLESKDIEIRKQQQEKEINNYFVKPFEVMLNSESEALYTLEKLQAIDVSNFDLCYEYAKSMQLKAVNRIQDWINKHRYLKEQEQQKEVHISSTTDDLTPFETPNAENHRPVKVVEEYPKPKQIDNENKELHVNAVFKVTCPNEFSNEDIVNGIKELLLKAGCDEDNIVKVEVV